MTHHQICPLHKQKVIASNNTIEKLKFAQEALSYLRKDCEQLYELSERLIPLKAKFDPIGES